MLVVGHSSLSNQEPFVRSISSHIDSAVFVAGALCIVAASASAQTRGTAAHDPLVVPTSWLASHLHDANLVVVHVGDRAEYDAKHIPGARFVAMQDISVTDRTPAGQILEMPPVEQLQRALSTLGISGNSRIVVYYGKDWITPATRIVYTLDYAGLGDHTSVLDGGMEAWSRDGNATTNVATPAPAPGKLAALSVKPIVVDAAYVRAHIGKPGFSIVDGRASAFYDGVQTGGGGDRPHKTGHIAGAKNVPYTEITDDKLIFKSVDQLSALFAKVGVAPTDTIIGYCHIGQQATGMLFAARLTGHPVLLYDGSFDDWSRHTDYPVDNPSTKKP
jgi:thiosulfate/3-mercaptopyruvate sulfurtransferase